VETKDEQPKKRKRDVDDDDGGKDLVIKKLTESKRKNKLLVHNPDLGTALGTSITPESAAAEGQEKSKKKKRREEGSRIKVIEPKNVVEVVYDDSLPKPPRQDPDSFVEEITAMTDLEWLRSRTSRTFGLVLDSEESDSQDKREEKGGLSDAENEDEEERLATPATDPSDIEEEEQQQPAPKISTAESKILKTGRLFLRNLVYGITEDDLRNTFSPFGQIEEVCFPSFSLQVIENMMIKQNDR
jgi:RNA recognition motif. (a.k.a. RRM, RBD, or RNP domain)